MSRVAHVLEFRRVNEDGVQIALLKVDPGGEPITVVHNGAPGDDSQPLEGDSLVFDEDRDNAVGYADTKNAGITEPGERRVYSRKADGSVVAHVHLKADGTILLESMEGGTTITLTPNGNVEIKPGNQVKIGGNPVSAVALAQATDQRFQAIESFIQQLNSGWIPVHTHPDALGGTGPTPAPAPPFSPGDTVASEITFSE